MAFEAAKYCGLEAVAKIGRDHADQIGALSAERTREIVGAISKLLCRFHYTPPSFLREACRLGDVVKNHRDRRSRQTEVLGQLSQCNSGARVSLWPTVGRTGFHTLRLDSSPAYHVRFFRLDKADQYELESVELVNRFTSQSGTVYRARIGP